METKRHSEELIQETLLLAKNGDKEAFGLIFDMFSDRIYRFVSFKIQNRLAAEDILQDVFLKAWVGLPKLEVNEDLNFSAWIYRIASNTVNDYFRKKYRQPDVLQLDENIADRLSAGDLVGEEFMRTEGSEIVRHAFKDLPVQYKQVLELRYIEGFSVTETANILGKTNLAVRLAQHRALNKLKDILENKYAFQF